MQRSQLSGSVGRVLPGSLEPCASHICRPSLWGKRHGHCRSTRRAPACGMAASTKFAHFLVVVLLSSSDCSVWAFCGRIPGVGALAPRFYRSSAEASFATGLCALICAQFTCRCIGDICLARAAGPWPPRLLLRLWRSVTTAACIIDLAAGYAPPPRAPFGGRALHEFPQPFSEFVLRWPT